MKKTYIKKLLSICLLSVLANCVPAHLAKYRSSSDETMLSEPVKKAKPAPPTINQATIYAVNNQTFRFLIKDDKVWNAAVDVLMRNYNLTIVDRQTGIITTEWDSFYLDSKVYRNKVSIRVSRHSRNQADLTILNNVEYLRDSQGSFNSVWLPFEDKNGEAGRIIQNMALILKQPPPILPPGMKLAKSALDDIIFKR